MEIYRLSALALTATFTTTPCCLRRIRVIWRIREIQVSIIPGVVPVSECKGDVSMKINTNISAMMARNVQRLHSKSLSSSVERLSNGLKLNRGADNPSGLGTSEVVKAQVKGTNTAIHNVEESIYLYSLRDDYFQELEEMLNRMRDLAVRASNEATLTTRDLGKMDEEVQAMKREVNRKALASYQVDGGRLLFNPTDLDVIWVLDDTASMGPYANSLKNDAPSMFSQLAKAGFDLRMGVVGFDSILRNYGSTSFQKSATDFTTDVDAILTAIGAPLSGVENGIDAVNSALALGTLGGDFRANAEKMVILLTDEDSDDFEYTRWSPAEWWAPPADPGLSSAPNAAAADAIRNACIANLVAADATLHVAGVVKDSSGTLQNTPDDDYQVIASDPTINGGVYTLDTGGAWVTSITSAMLAQGDDWTVDFQVGPDSNHSLTETFKSVTTESLGIDSVNLAAVSSAMNSIDVVDRAKENLSNMRLRTANIVSRLQHIANDLAHQNINNSDFSSRLKDADMEEEIVQFTKTQLLSDTATSAQAHADSNIESAMQLIDVVKSARHIARFNDAFYNRNM